MGGVEHRRVAPLSIWANFEPGSEVIFHPSTPGSLVDLADDLGWAPKLNFVFTDQFADHMLVVDRHITPATRAVGLNDLSSINQAVGVLLSRGRLPLTAVEDLKRAGHPGELFDRCRGKGVDGPVRSVTGLPVDLSALTARAPWAGIASSGDLCGLYRGECQRDEIMLPSSRCAWSGAIGACASSTARLHHRSGSAFGWS